MVRFNKKFLIILAFFIGLNYTVCAINNNCILAKSEFYNTIQQELNALKNYGTPFQNNNNIVNITDIKNTALAPTLFNLLYQITNKYAIKAKINTPEICIQFNNYQNKYYASMQTKYWTNQYNVVTSTRHRLLIGKDLLNLFIWDKSNMDALDATIAHEIGHAVNLHIEASNIENEHIADECAISLMDNPKSLLKTLDMFSIATNIFIKLQRYNNRLSKEQAEYITIVLTNAIIKEYPFPGNLKHISIQTIISMFFHHILQSFSNIPARQNNIEATILRAYDIFKYIRTSPGQFLGLNCHTFENYLYQVNEDVAKQYKAITHPTPKNRKNFIIQCIERKKRGQHRVQDRVQDREVIKNIKRPIKSKKGTRVSRVKNIKKTPKVSRFKKFNEVVMAGRVVR